MTDYRIFTGAGAPWPPASAPPPPAASTSFSSPIILAVGFTLSSYAWYKGPSYWRAGTAAPGGAQKFALLQMTGAVPANPQAILAAGTITSGSLTAGQWNDTLLGTPVQLMPGVPYMVSTGLTGNFNFVTNFWTSGGGSAGLVNGPLKFYKSGGDPYANPQSLFTTGGTNDPTVTLPGTANSGFDAGIDAIITDTAPTGATYRIYAPGIVPDGRGALLAGTDAATIAMQFAVSSSQRVTNIWHYSAPACTALPDDCAIYSVASQTAVVTVASATWSGAAGSGWVRCTNLPATTLPAGSYKVAIHRASTGPQWFTAVDHFWTTGNGSAGFTNGPLSAPNSAGSANGQGSFNNTTPGVLTYPTQFDDECYWLDIEVTPAPATSSGLLLTAFP